MRINGPATWLALLALSAGSLVGSLGLGQFFGITWNLDPNLCDGSFFCLWAVSHITLNSQQTFFSLLKNDWNTSLAWFFAIAALITNFTWCIPQFRFGVDVTSSSLLLFLDNKPGKICTALLFLIIAILFSFWYEKSGSRSMLFQWSLRSMLLLLVGLLCIALCLLFSNSALIFKETIVGFSLSFSNFTKVHSQYHGLLELCGDMKQFWENQLLSTQRQFLLVTFSSTLGINLLFAYPLLLLGRNWRRGHVSFSNFNLLTGLLLPFIVCTVSLVVLSAVVSQHQISQSEIAVFKNTGEVHLTESKPMREILNQRIIHEIGFDHFDALAPFQQDELILSLPPAEKHLATLSVPNGIKDWIEILNEIGGSVMQPYTRNCCLTYLFILDHFTYDY